jgi:glycosyltransferase involved in cell wall biosynthesis
MRVSVVVPLFNKARYIARCLQSILSQDFADFELIVVNDGSTDGGEEVVADCSDARVRLVNQSNAGPGAARNRGIAEASGEYVAFLDADDEWLPGYLQRQVCAFEQYPSAASVTCSYVEKPSSFDVKAFWLRRGIEEGLQRVTAATPAMMLVYMVAYMLPCNTLSRLNVLREFDGFYEKDRCVYAEDAFLWLQVLLNCPVAFSFEPLVRIHRAAAELSQNLAGCRPVEPFFVRPDLVEASCPPALRVLLRDFLAIRALKTACVLGYWGNWAGAKRLRARFSGSGDWRLPYFLPSLICSTPAGSFLGAAWRKFKRV